MYRPPAFREDRLETLHALIAAHPLAMLITGGADGLNANLIPFTIATDRGEKGTLRAHLAKANDQMQALRESTEALVIFQGPESYITPSWYASKAEHARFQHGTMSSFRHGESRTRSTILNGCVFKSMN
jgi:transcriptional regulator